MKNELTIIAGPCAIESYDICAKVAETIFSLSTKHGFDYVFKSSFDKANRSSHKSYRGPGLEKGLKILDRIKKNFGVRITTDIHETDQAKVVGEVVDIIQIPAFLSRQNDLLKAAALASDVINVKKGQFMPHFKIKQLVEKVKFYNESIHLMVTERGSQFGYNDYVVDFPSLIKNLDLDCDLCLDITHSTQKKDPGKIVTKGDYRDAFVLAKCAVVNNIDTIFFETHPNIDVAKSDKDSMIPLDLTKKLIEDVIRIRSVIQDHE